jgi:hypothetical protein
MKKIILSACLLFSITHVNAQFRKENTDSLEYYRKKANDIRIENMKALRENADYKKTLMDIHRLEAKTDNYAAFALYTSIASADFSKFNSDNARAGFSGFAGQMFGIGFGYSNKNKRRMFQFNVGSIGIRKRITKGNENIRTSFQTMVQFEWGYDLIKSNRINIYPFAGFGFRDSYIAYNGEGSTNTNATNITEVVINSRGITGSQSAFSLQAGLGLETVLTKANRGGGVILFVTGGTNQPIGAKPIRLSSVRYDPQLKYGNLDFRVGFKFFGRK